MAYPQGIQALSTGYTQGAYLALNPLHDIMK